ncbi:MAG: hypothetical protein V8S98_05590 [Lachnospiraceae bacterium]
MCDWNLLIRLLAVYSTMYAMGENNFLPKAFTKLNRHQQPVLPIFYC